MLYRNLLKCGLVATILAVLYFFYDLPDIDQVKPLDTRPSISVLASDGTLIARYGGARGDFVEVQDLPQYVPQAVLAIEDRRFYDHFGIDPLGLARAMLVNAMAANWVQGGSTITQQLAKNLFLTSDKTLRRKVQEAILAFQIERRYTKDEILSAYLNRVYFGSGAYGIDAAARIYFGKSAQDLSLWEGAMLAGLLKAPSRFSPAADPRLARERAEVVIRAMEDAGYIGQSRMKKEIDGIGTRFSSPTASGPDRYFADWIVNQIDSFVTGSDTDLVIRTTLNADLQRLSVAHQQKTFAAIKPEANISQAALVTLSTDGAVLAMIGGVDYRVSQFNRATQALRQPGSAFKPFVFLAALEAGYDPDDMIEDSPLARGDYRPGNYEDKYYGEVTLTDALALSMNTATVRLLGNIGVARLIDVAQRLGFTNSFRPELATGLGASEVNLLELTNAYAVIANGGRAIWPYAVLSIEDAAGNIFYQYEPAGQAELFSRRDISALDGMLVQVVARGTGQAAQLSRGHVAGKTGTTQNYRDAWFIGYTDRLITGVWMGNDDNKPMERITGGSYPARLWRGYMEDALRIPVPERYRSADRGFSQMIDSWTSPRERSKPVYNP